LFPNTTTLAAYYHTEQVVELSSVQEKDFDSAISKSDPHLVLKVVPLLIHELQHWFDHTSTVWGQRRLVSAFNAIHARSSNIASEFWRIASHLREMRGDYLADYYTTMGEKKVLGDGEPWRFQLTSGYRFDSLGKLDLQSPVVFTQFKWGDGSAACRVPFSVSALLECSAMDMEVKARVNGMTALEIGEQRVERQLLHRESQKNLYAPEVAVYSVAVHACANRLSLNDVVTAYDVAGALSSICLNLPSGTFKSIVTPSEFDPWRERVDGLIRRCDRGYAFLALLYNAPRQFGGDVREWIDGALRASGLPVVSDLRPLVLQEMSGLRAEAISGEFDDRLSWLLGLGVRHFEECDMTVKAVDAMVDPGSRCFPPVVLGDCSLKQLGPAARWHDATEVESWWETCRLQRSMWTEFTDACHS
jgi:hypothetical protein